MKQIFEKEIKLVGDLKCTVSLNDNKGLLAEILFKVNDGKAIEMNLVYAELQGDVGTNDYLNRARRSFLDIDREYVLEWYLKMILESIKT